MNFGHDPLALLRRLPLQAVEIVHISGGVRMGRRLLDDHLHDVPDPVYQMLEVVGERCSHVLTVILERDAALKIDPEELALAARSFAAKRTATGRDTSGRRTEWKRLAMRRADPCDGPRASSRSPRSS